VYATGESSKELSEFSIKEARTEQSKIDVKAIEKLVQLSYEAGGRIMRFPMGRNLLGGFGGGIFGTIFGGAGWWLIKYEGHPIMGGAFGLMGLLITVSAIYMVLNSLEVSQEGVDIRTVRRILGIPVKRGQMRRADFDRNGQKLVVGEGFKGASQADAAADYIAGLFGLTTKNEHPEKGPAIRDYNLLMTD
jgi:hypothetical protein